MKTISGIKETNNFKCGNFQIEIKLKSSITTALNPPQIFQIHN